MCAYLGTIQMGETFFDGQAHWLGHIPPIEPCPSSEGEEGDLVTVVEREGRLRHRYWKLVGRAGSGSPFMQSGIIKNRDYEARSVSYFTYSFLADSLSRG